MRFHWVAVCTLLAAILSLSEAQAGKRVALIIGNSSYENISPLDNPKNDAALMKQTLASLGFDVVDAIDADRRAMGRAIRDFGKLLRAAGSDATGLFYYAGHGVQAGGENFLVPIGAQIEDQADLDLEAVSASDILKQMESAGNALNIVILDACRNNPFKGKVRSGSRGLARVQAASGSLVAFAAAPGQVASDGDTKNSPYTAALAKAMLEPGLAVEQVFKRVRVAVESQTGGRQTPWEESSLRGDFYFTPAKPSQATQTEPGAANQEPAGFDERALELAFWETIKESQSPAAFEEYLSRWPSGTFSGLAKIKLGELKRMQTAALKPTETKEAEEEDRVDKATLTRRLQRALKRAGCDPGTIDGQWGGKGRAALSRFNEFAKTNLPVDAPSERAVKAVEGVDEPVCPAIASLPGDDTKSALPGSGFDGTWQVIKRSPSCQNKSSTFTVLIQGNTVTWGGGTATISTDGTLRITTRIRKSRRGRVQGQFVGRLSGNNGSGNFTGHNLDRGGRCHGTFTASRIAQ